MSIQDHHVKLFFLATITCRAGPYCYICIAVVAPFRTPGIGDDPNSRVRSMSSISQCLTLATLIQVQRAPEGSKSLSAASISKARHGMPTTARMASFENAFGFGSPPSMEILVGLVGILGWAVCVQGSLHKTSSLEDRQMIRFRTAVQVRVTLTMLE